MGNTFVQNPGPLPEVQPLVSAPAKPAITKVVAVTNPQQRPVAAGRLPKSSRIPSATKPQRSEKYVRALAKHYFDVLNTRAIYSGWLDPATPKKKKSKKN